MYFTSLSLIQWILLAVGALLIGANKAGFRGITMVVIPVFASLFGGRISAAIILPLLITGDICAVWIYRKNVEYRYLWKMLPATLIGLAAGMVLGRRISDRTFQVVMGCFLLVCLVLMAFREFRQKDLALPDHWAAHSTSGFLAGLTTMIGNAAGPIMAIYLLSLNLPKTAFIATGAIFFFIVNMLKVPIHWFLWGSMTADTLLLSAILAPLVLLGLIAGVRIVKHIPDRPYRILILAATLAGTIKLFF